MQLKLKGYFKEDNSPVAEALKAVEMLEATSMSRPHVLGYTPVGRTNPYQSLLYRAAEDYNIATVPVVKSWDFQKLFKLPTDNSNVILHIHWTSFILHGITSYNTAKKKIQDFRAAINDIKSKGGKIVWTLHNIIPHDSLYPDLEMQIQQFLAEQADVLHVLSDASAEMMSAALTIDKRKLVNVPHPNYRLTYEDYVTRRNARLEFGIGPNDRVYVLLGALKAYKGLDRLLKAFDGFRAGDPSIRRVLLVGGMADESAEVTEFVKKCLKHPDILIEPKKVPNHMVQNYMRAADVGLAPYTRMLNSGAVLLYQSFDLPVIASDVPAIWENMTEEIGERVADNSVQSLVSAFERADRFFENDVRRQVRSYADQFDATVLSREFASRVLWKLGGGSTESSAAKS
ncbi:glycosyltransferase [Paenarthrobacter sp. NPDC090522]|uniref:glycosyltransferase n=1 Tax=Paenarthrobacter sp. NPDC090522 TaxID=3364383 RepID=UPI003810AE7D